MLEFLRPTKILLQDFYEWTYCVRLTPVYRRKLQYLESYALDVVLQMLFLKLSRLTVLIYQVGGSRWEWDVP